MQSRPLGSSVILNGSQRSAVMCFYCYSHIAQATLLLDFEPSSRSQIREELNQSRVSRSSSLAAYQMKLCNWYTIQSAVNEAQQSSRIFTLGLLSIFRSQRGWWRIIPSYKPLLLSTVYDLAPDLISIMNLNTLQGKPSPCNTRLHLARTRGNIVAKHRSVARIQSEQQYMVAMGQCDSGKYSLMRLRICQADLSQFHFPAWE